MRYAEIVDKILPMAGFLLFFKQIKSCDICDFTENISVNEIVIADYKSIS